MENKTEIKPINEAGEKIERIDNAVRIVKYKGLYPYAVEFTALFEDGTIDVDNWGMHDLGPGSVCSQFKTTEDAEKFIVAIKSWKPSDKFDDGLEYFQTTIKRINGWVDY